MRSLAYYSWLAYLLKNSIDTAAGCLPSTTSNLIPPQAGCWRGGVSPCFVRMQNPSGHVSFIEQGTADETKCEGCWSTYAQQLLWKEESVLVLPAWLPATRKTEYLCRMCDCYSFRRWCSCSSWLLEGTKTRTMLSNCPASETSRCRWHPAEKDCVSCAVRACYACFWLHKKDWPKEPRLKGWKHHRYIVSKQQAEADKKIYSKRKTKSNMPPRGIEPRTFSCTRYWKYKWNALPLSYRGNFR